MGVPVSKLKTTQHSLTLMVGGKHKDHCRAEDSEQEDDAVATANHFDVRLITAKKAFDQSTKAAECSHANESEQNNEHLAQHDHNETSHELDDTDRGGATPSTNEAASLNQLKFIDDNETTVSTDEGGFMGGKDSLENDTDSGNASISSDSHHDHDSFHDEFLDDLAIKPILRQNSSSSLSTVKLYSTLNNRLSTGSFMRNYSTLSSSSSMTSTSGAFTKFEQYNIRKIVSKLNPGDIVEIRCQCSCQKSNQLRASINHRQRFRRSVQRQSFHQYPITSPTTSQPSKRTNSFTNRFSCISSSNSINDLTLISPSDNSASVRNKLMPLVLANLDQQCAEQLHYVYVEKITPFTQSSNKSIAGTADNLLQNVWCFHVRPYQRVALLEDDKNLGVIKHETLESIVGQFLFEMEERHWHCSHKFKPQKTHFHYQIRNQEKLSQEVLKQTLNAQPDTDRMLSTLHDIKDSHVRYHKSLCNSEHYATLWKYGIGWSRAVNERSDIVRTLHKFVQSLCQVSTGNSFQLQGGECLQEQTNLIVHCFGLHGTKLEKGIREWMCSQIVIGKSMPDTSVMHQDESSGDEPSVASPHNPIIHLQSVNEASEPVAESDEHITEMHLNETTVDGWATSEDECSPSQWAPKATLSTDHASQVSVHGSISGHHVPLFKHVEPVVCPR